MSRMIFALVLCAFSLAAAPSGAEEMGDAPVIPPSLAKQIKSNPDRFFDDAAGLILGFGKDGQIDAGTIDLAIALDRAVARASALRRVMATDLDADGAVTPKEANFATAAASASQRGRLDALLAGIDTDRDGTASATEIAAYGREQGLRAVPEREAAAMKSLLTLDANADGSLSLAELRQAVDQVATAM
jgi:EF hand